MTGVSGFVAQHCARTLLEAGYRVRGTVRHERDARQLAERLSVGLDGSRIELRRADLTADAGWGRALEGCEGVLHVASPLPSRVPRHEDELLIPAREGTLRVLRAAQRAKVRRVVLTSSLAAVVFDGSVGGQAKDESNWSHPALLSPYDKSKTLAERAAWDYWRELGANACFELVVLNPGLVLGPVLEARAPASSEVIRRLLQRRVRACPRVQWAAVDVRDLATAQLLALTNPAAGGQRFCCAAGPIWFSQIAALLAEHFAARGLRVATRTAPDIAVRLRALWDPGARLLVHKLGKSFEVSTERIRRVLGFAPRALAETVIDTAESLIAHGLI